MNLTPEQWIDQAVSARGVLAATIRRGQECIVRVRRDGLSQVRAEEAFRRLEEAIRSLQQSQPEMQHLRWTFEQGRIEGMIRTDGTIAALLVSKDLARPETLTQLFANFPAKGPT